MSVRLALVLAAAACTLQGAVPSPVSFFGHRMGEDRKLLAWRKVVEYFQALEKGSDRIRVQTLGSTTLGRPFIVATIAAPETIRDLDRYQQIQKRLADPRGTPENEAAKLMDEGKTVVLITCSIHSTEVASTSTAIEFAHRLLTDDSDKSRAILANTIFLLVPSLNPDGVDIVTNWYQKTLGTPHEGTSPPELYHKYVGHDNNRDWYIFSQVETRLAIEKIHNLWHPQIVYDVHQQGAFASRMFVPPWLDPIDPNIDPIIAQQCNAIGSAMAADLTTAGKTGIAINAMYDFWTPARHYQAYHAGLRILSESASAKLATPISVRFEEIAQNALGYSPRERSWNHLQPWLGGTWRQRDIVDYQLIAMESLLYQAAVRRHDLLRGFYKIGERAVARTSPYAFVIPAAQFDAGSTRKLLEVLNFGLVEIDQAARPFEAGGKKYPGGSFVIRMRQPYSSFAKTLLERQEYPDLRMYPGGPPKRPYDVTAHTLPLLMGVIVDTIEQRFQAPLQPAKEFRVPAAPGMPAANIDSWREVNRIWNSGRSVWRDRASGDFHRAAYNGRVELRAPRIGLYKSHIPSMDEGWTRWLLEEFGFRYASLGNRNLLAGGLRGKYDVIVFPDQEPGTIHNGYRPGTMPEEFAGGLGERGAEELKRFLQQGGRVVFLNHSTDYAVGHLGVPAKNVLRGLSNREFYSPGSLLNVTLDPRNPLSLGLPERIAIWSEDSPAWDSDTAVARYTQNDILASGWLLGFHHLAGKAALLDLPVGNGRAILFGMRPQYRAQSYQAFKIFFNALVYSREDL